MNRLLVFFFALLTGCQCVVPDDRAYACGPGGECPDALVCEAELCVERATVTDSGTPDSGSIDSGALDSGTPDAGTPDAGSSDSGVDAGTPDSGFDAGPYVPGDLIETAIPLEWDGGIFVRFSGTLVGAHDDLSSGSCLGSGVELFYSFVGTPTMRANVNSGSVTVSLRAAAGSLWCSPAEITAPPDGGAYLLVVETNGVPGAFSIDLTRGGAPFPSTCALADSPVTVPEDGGVLIWSSSTVALGGTHYCRGRGYADGPRFAFRLSRAGLVHLTLNSGIRQALFLLEDRGCDGPQDAGDPCTDGDGGLDVTLAAGVHWLVVGPDTITGGPFEVRISR